MWKFFKAAVPAVVAVTLFSGTVRAVDLTHHLSAGKAELQSAGPLAFGPDGILFVADTQGASVFAIATGDQTPAPSKPSIQVSMIDVKVASVLGTTPQKMRITDLAVNPLSGHVYLSVARGTGTDAQPVLVKVDGTGQVEVLSLDNVKYAKASLPNAKVSPDRSGRSQAITDIAYVDGRLFVAGLSNEEFSSRLMSIPFPFVESGDGTSLEIYHGAHGRFETKSPIRTFVPFSIKGEPHLMAAYTCTPLVKIPVADLKAGAHVKGVTVAELGNRNNPLDMVAYSKDGKDYILLTNSARGVMKIDTAGVDQAQSISAPIQGTDGLPYQTIEALKNVEQLDGLDSARAVILARSGEALNIETIELP